MIPTEATFLLRTLLIDQTFKQNSLSNQNQYSQAHALNDDLASAIQEACDPIAESLGGDIDLVFIFAAGYASADFDRLAGTIKGKLNAKTVLGCTCETVVGGDYEMENATSLSIFAAKLPNADLLPMHLNYQRADESAIIGWPGETDGPWPEDSVLLLLGEPFSFPVDILLERFNEDRPDVRIAGGMASGAYTPGQSRLLFNEETFDEGLLAVRISGVPIRMLVSQGCRPIGEPMVVTGAERNIIESLGGKKSLDVVHELFNTLPTSEQRLFQNGLHLGRVVNEYQDKFEFGDFLIRNVIGIDKEQRSITIGDYVRPGQTVQFHIRDEQSASLELEQLLKASVEQEPFAACLLFTCNGRGTNMFSDPHHDVLKVQAANRNPDGTAAKVPVAGFFAAGEIGPVGNKSFLHGFTACVVLFQ